MSIFATFLKSNLDYCDYSICMTQPPRASAMLLRHAVELDVADDDGASN